jgi:hypothetical protein
MQENGAIPCPKARPRHYMNHYVGWTGAHLASIASRRDSESGEKNPEIRVELVLDGKNAKQHFEALKKEDRKIINNALGSLVCHNPEDENQCRIYVRRSGDFLDAERWPELHQWLKENLETFSNDVRTLG